MGPSVADGTTAKAARRAVRLPFPGGPAAIWLLTAGILVAAALLALVERGGSDTRGGWPVFALLAVLFGLAEAFVVHLHFRKDSHSFSLLEIPLVLGLFLAGTWVLLGAQLVGGGAVLLFHRRQPAIKLAFNLASFVLETIAALVVFERLVALMHPNVGIADLHPDATSWLAAVAAVMTASLLGVLLVFAAISLSEHDWHARRLAGPLRFGLLTALFTCSLGLIAVTVIEVSQWAGVLLVVPTTGVYLASRAYTSERQRHSSLDFLYQSTRLLHQSEKLESAVVDMLNRARAAFRTEVAELCYVPAGAGEALRTVVGPGDEVLRMQSSAVAGFEQVWRAFAERGMGTVAVERSAAGPPEFQAFLEASGLQNALVAPLRGEMRLIGLIILGNRLSRVSKFSGSDLRLVDTLASHVSVALENGRLEQSLEQLQVLKNQLIHQAFHDPLTNLANRMLFGERVTEALESETPEAPVSVLFIDLDDFKTVNDTLGHAAGDELLLATAARLSACVRASDTVARLGGDEFGILLEDGASRSDPAAIAERIIGAMSEPVSVFGHELAINVSVGIARAGGDYSTAELLRNADTAMYVAKSKGKHRYEVFAPNMYSRAAERYSLLQDLQHAVRAEEFSVYFQPLVEIGTREVVGAEALVRWRHPSLGLLAPPAFIELAEESGAVVAIGRVVLSEACLWLRRMDELFPDSRELMVAVNLGVKEFHESNFVAEIECVIAEHGIAPERLIFEISEELVLREAEGITILQDLKDLGVQLALDDFGTGCSSLNHLRQLPVDIIKIAKPFVDDLSCGTATAAFAHAIVNLGHVLGLRVVAEGIERTEQLTVVGDIDCEVGQGYYFSPPLESSAFEEWMRDWQAQPATRRVA
jgi:diguanylate cyclase (GGDEF)-like protein